MPATPAMRNPTLQPPFRAIGLGRLDQLAGNGAAEQKAGPRKEREVGAAGQRANIGFDRIRQHREPSRLSHQRRAHRQRRGGHRKERDANGAMRRQAPQDRRREHREAHDVENVDLEEVDERSPAEQLRLQPEEEREREDLQPAQARHARGRTMTHRCRARRRGHRERQAGEEQEQRRRQAGDEHRVAVQSRARDPRRASTRR